MAAIERKITIDDTYMNVISFGEGSRNLIIIAGVNLTGLEGQGEGVAEAYKVFQKDYTVYLFDRKAVLPEDYSVKEMAEDIYRVLKELGVNKTSVYGVSQGGMIAQCLAIYHPELVEKLVVCSSMCRNSDDVSDILNGWLALSEAEDVVGLNRMFFKQVYSPRFLESVKDLLPALEQVGTPENCRRFHSMAKAILTFDVSEDLPKVQCPTLVLGDENDRVIGPEGSREIAEILGCEIYMYNDYSHAVYDECPEIKDRIYTFLSE